MSRNWRIVTLCGDGAFCACVYLLSSQAPDGTDGGAAHCVSRARARDVVARQGQARRREWLLSEGCPAASFEPIAAHSAGGTQSGAARGAAGPRGTPRPLGRARSKMPPWRRAWAPWHLDGPRLSRGGVGYDKRKRGAALGGKMMSRVISAKGVKSTRGTRRLKRRGKRAPGGVVDQGASKNGNLRHAELPMTPTRRAPAPTIRRPTTPPRRRPWGQAGALVAGQFGHPVDPLARCAGCDEVEERWAREMQRAADAACEPGRPLSPTTAARVRAKMRARAVVNRPVAAPLTRYSLDTLD